MKIRIFLSAVILAFCTLYSSTIQAQVDSVRYQSRYNPDDCVFDFYLVIEGGSATTIAQRAQFNSQYTVVIPTGTAIIGQPINHNPIQNNQSYTGTTPMKWQKSSFVSNPGAAPGNDFQSIIPTLSPASFYNNLATGDTVKLFSLEIDPVPDCGEGVRIFENGVDPGSDAEGMDGGDFSNGFTIGGSQQKYVGNHPSVAPPLPGLSAITMCEAGVNIDLSADVSTCQAPPTYAWTGPNGYTGSTEDVSITPATAANAGTYTVTVTDAIGCSSVLDVEVVTPPEAGDDINACAGETVNLQGSNPTSGTWTADATNGPGATLTPGINGAATVDLAGTATGDYSFTYTNEGCEDKVTITVNAADAGPDPSPLNCFSAGSASLNGVGTGTWSVAPLISAGTADIADASSATTTVGNFSGPGDYYLVFTSGPCSDTTLVVTNNNCNCDITNNIITPPNPSIFCGTSGPVFIDGASATPAGNYLWESSTNGSTFSAASGANTSEDYTTADLPAGIYDFRRIYNSTTGIICSDTSNMVNITVSDDPNPPANLTAIPNPLCLGETTDLSVTNNPNATFTWTASSPLAGLGTSSSNVNQATPTAVGTYTISVTQTVDGCESLESTVEITVSEQPPTPVAGDFTFTDPTACQANDGTITIANLSPSTTYTLNYDYNNGAQSVSITTDGTGSVTLMNLAPGTYMDFSLATAAGCTSGAFAGPITLSDPNPPNAPENITADPNPACIGEDITITVDDNPGAVYSWSVNNPNGTLSASTSNTVTLTASQAGFYTVEVFQTVDGCISGVTSLVVQFLDGPPTPNANTVIGADPSGCGATDGSITLTGLTANQAYDLTYFANGTQVDTLISALPNGSIVLMNLPEGNYTNFSLTNTTNGCSSGVYPGPVSLSEPGAPGAPENLMGQPNPSCLGELVTLSVTNNPGATYTWTSDDPAAGLVSSTTNTTTMTATAPGTYTIFVSQSIGDCTSPSAMIDVVVFDIPPTPDAGTVSFSNPTACGVSDGSISISGLTNGIVYTVTYSINGAQTMMDLTASASGIIIIPNLGAGNYSDFSLSNAAGCSSSVYNGPVILSDPNAPDAPTGLTAAPNPVCFTGTVNLSVDNTTGATYTWSASSPFAGLVASTTSSTTMTATQPGIYTISVTQTIAGCESPAATIDVEVLAAPPTPDIGSINFTDPSSCNVSDGTISLSGLVPGEMYVVDYTLNGVPAMITLTANGSGVIILTSLSEGSYGNFSLTNEAGCESGEIDGTITLIEPGAPMPPSGLQALPNPACIGSVVDVSVTANGNATFTWSASSPDAGLAAGSTNQVTLNPTAAGVYTVSVTQTIGGCTSAPATIDVLVLQDCYNPDFGVTWNDYTLTGDLSTNDGGESGTTYGNPIALSSNPTACMPVVAANGTYTFDCSVPGEYQYVVEVCKPFQSTGCEAVPLVITVLEIESDDNPPVANHDYISTPSGTPVLIEILSNDECQSNPTCDLENATVLFGPANGTFNPSTGMYTPNAGFVGEDNVVYEVCQDPATTDPCDFETIYIDVYPATATGYTNAMDDYGQTALNTPLVTSASNGVLANGSDPLNSTQVVSGHVTSVTGKGTIEINTDGSYEFTPADGFIGPVDFAYQVCRQNNSSICDSATLHLLVEPMAPTGNVSSCVWEDVNGNGIFQPGEPGIPGVTINMYDVNSQLVATTISGFNGNYTFSDILQGDYYLEFLAPDDYEPTFPNVGNETNDSDIDGSFGEFTTALFTLGAGQTIENIKGGFYLCVEIGENVWYDVNKNDIFDPTENGINGLKVNLWRNDGGGYQLYETLTTGHKPNTPSDDGYFIFCAPPGTYYIEVVMPPQGLVQALPFKGNDPYRDSDLNNAFGQGTTSSFTLNSGESKLDIGAGFYPQALAGNKVWFDENFDGVQNPDEAPVAGVSVKAINAQTFEVVGEAITDANGIYVIDFLDKNQVFFEFEAPEGYVATVAGVGFDAIDSDVDHSYGLNTTRKFSPIPDETNENIDFGVAFGALPVTWLDVYVTKSDKGHTITWEVEQEINVTDYEVERSITGGSDFAPINADRIPSNNTADVSIYSALDNSLSHTGRYYYRVKQYDFDGKVNYSKVVTIENEAIFSSRIYPNPSTGLMTIEFTMDRAGEMEISVLNSVGSTMYSATKMLSDGGQNIELDLSDLPAGTYTISLTTNGISTQKRIILLE